MVVLNFLGMLPEHLHHRNWDLSSEEDEHGSATSSTYSGWGTPGESPRKDHLNVIPENKVINRVTGKKGVRRNVSPMRDLDSPDGFPKPWPPDDQYKGLPIKTSSDTKVPLKKKSSPMEPRPDTAIPVTGEGAHHYQCDSATSIESEMDIVLADSGTQIEAQDVSNHIKRYNNSESADAPLSRIVVPDSPISSKIEVEKDEPCLMPPHQAGFKEFSPEAENSETESQGDMALGDEAGHDEGGQVATLLMPMQDGMTALNNHMRSHSQDSTTSTDRSSQTEDLPRHSHRRGYSRESILSDQSSVSSRISDLGAAPPRFHLMGPDRSHLTLDVQSHVDHEYIEEVHKVAESVGTPLALTPEGTQTEVAQRLALIGDEMAEKYKPQFENALGLVMGMPRENVTYDVFVNITKSLLDAIVPEPHGAFTHGWARVACLLVFSRDIGRSLVGHGQRGLNELVQYTERIVTDQYTEFIINQGGWGAVSEMPLDTPTSSCPSTPAPQTPGDTMQHPGFPVTPQQPIDGANCQGQTVDQSGAVDSQSVTVPTPISEEGIQKEEVDIVDSAKEPVEEVKPSGTTPVVSDGATKSNTKYAVYAFAFGALAVSAFYMLK
ncbi:unnamed protein product [Owenia fusiformis]|uniref:Uncharacterized protein n=1 Tax=Owenia fusiformis TaxID=6347 RepID=A0A8J1XHY5_OWEFU|nr:unnamed protein product [Owenia fusiformis]